MEVTPEAVLEGEPIELDETDAALLTLLRQVNTMHANGRFTDAEFGAYVSRFLS
ncbi:hypothetical protein [Leucobacter ruminantium]|uniref:Uncharacterized protein n=1 Tax=Leucobacter ruminantium TaxID=1289170 RepID=A0A939M0M9_9MICO|nr:hypothetical protein [Leucobacter ruminantium]MBO1806398.1 hypothetical protein [Leucobacter ruminantium]